MRSNTNPLYLTEFLGTAAAIYGAGAAAATGIKYGRMKFNAKKIISRYPTPQDLKEALLKIGSPNAQNIAAHLDLMSSQEDYYNFVQKYICGSKTGNWIANALLPASALYQAGSAIADTSEPTYDKLISAAS